MNGKGDVRSASEFKSIFEDYGVSFRPYKCPFCEVLYEDRCIITECVKAPHFKLPDNTVHINGCNGESGTDEPIDAALSEASSKRTVVGKIEIPEALVKRRKATLVRRPEDDGLGPPPDAVEVKRRRKLVAADSTISKRFTTPQLRPIIHAYKRLRKFAYDQAVAAKLQKGTPEYNACFRKTLDAHALSLYGQKLTYGNAFHNFRLQPSRLGRIYSGSGELRAEGNYFVITDENLWPRLPKSKTDVVGFEVRMNRVPPAGASTSYLHAVEELERIVNEHQRIEWNAYGIASLQEEKFVLMVDYLDDFYRVGQHQR